MYHTTGSVIAVPMGILPHTAATLPSPDPKTPANHNAAYDGKNPWYRRRTGHPRRADTPDAPYAPVSDASFPFPAGAKAGYTGHCAGAVQSG